MVKYYFANLFNIQAGLQFDRVIDVPEKAEDLFDALGFIAVVGLGYDFRKKIGIQINIHLELQTV